MWLFHLLKEDRDQTEDHTDDDTYWDISQSTAMLANYDSISDELRLQPYSLESVVKNQLKYMIQEVVFFVNPIWLSSVMLPISPEAAKILPSGLVSVTTWKVYWFLPDLALLK